MQVYTHTRGYKKLGNIKQLDQIHNRVVSKTVTYCVPFSSEYPVHSLWHINEIKKNWTFNVHINIKIILHAISGFYTHFNMLNGPIFLDRI